VIELKNILVKLLYIPQFCNFSVFFFFFFFSLKRFSLVYYMCTKVVPLCSFNEMALLINNNNNNKIWQLRACFTIFDNNKKIRLCSWLKAFIFSLW
jgi:hypothetical protein